MTEEQIREQYPWDYRKLTEECQSRYQDFKCNQKYHSIRKPLLGDERYSYTRRLDPENPKSSKKTFYNPNILQVMENITQRAKSTRHSLEVISLTLASGE